MRTGRVRPFEGPGHRRRGFGRPDAGQWEALHHEVPGTVEQLDDAVRPRRDVDQCRVRHELEISRGRGAHLGTALVQAGEQLRLREPGEVATAGRIVIRHFGIDGHRQVPRDAGHDLEGAGSKSRRDG